MAKESWKSPYSGLGMPGMARRLVSETARVSEVEGFSPNIRANMEVSDMDKAVLEELAAKKAENENLKRLLSEANSRVLELESALVPAKEEPKPWEKLAMSKATYFRKKKEGKL